MTAPCPAGRVELTVPGDWSTIELAGPGQRRRQIDALVVERVGCAEDQVALRRRLRDQLVAQADHAAGTGAWLLAFMLLVADRVPVPASLTAHQQSWSPTADGLGPLADRLARQLGDATLDRGTGRFGPYLRTVRYQDAAVDRGRGPVMMVDYWCHVGRHTLVGLTYTTPMVMLDVELLDLFDAITSTLAVRDGAPVPGAATVGRPVSGPG